MFETDALEELFYVFGVVIIKTGFADFGVVGWIFAPGVFFGTEGDVASHLGESALVGNFYDGNTAWF